MKYTFFQKEVEIELSFDDILDIINNCTDMNEKERIIEELYHSDGLYYSEYVEPELEPDDSVYFMTLDESSKYQLFTNNSHKFTYEELENFFNTK